MHRRKRLKNAAMMLIPWTGIALAAYAATEGCYVNGSPACIAAGSPCGNGGTAAYGATHQNAISVSTNGNQTLSTGATFDCKYYCSGSGWLTQTQTQSIPGGSTC